MSDESRVIIDVVFRTPEGRTGKYRFEPFRWHKKFCARKQSPLDTTVPPKAMVELMKQLKRDRCEVVSIEQSAQQAVIPTEE